MLKKERKAEMATKHECDRCGAEIKNYTGIGNQFKLPSLIQVIDTKATEKGAGYNFFDLCDICISNLRLWLGMESVDRVPPEGK